MRYADDLVACCHSQRQAEQVKTRLAAWLAPRGLIFNEDKTQTVHLTEGFDYLGFTLRRYRHGKLLIKPSDDAVRRLRKRLANEMRSLRGSNAMALIARLNPIIRKILSSLDNYVWRLTYKWATHTHPTKPKKWIARRYFGKFNKFRNDRWVFGDRGATSDRGQTPCLVKFSWTNIVRHQLVIGGASPDDPDLTDYWATRRRRVTPPLDTLNLRLLAKQDGRCPLCGDHLLVADQPPQSPLAWERWWLTTARRAIAADYLTHHGQPATPDGNRTRLVHTSCHRRLQARQHSRKPVTQPATPQRLA